MVRNNQNKISILTLDSTDTLTNDHIRTPTTLGDERKDLVWRLKVKEDSEPLGLSLHPLSDGVLVSVQPPNIPPKSINRTPCVIVLVIDVSISMGDEAPIPAGNPSERERNGLTILDLTKHAALTTIECLDENDRLALVTYSTEAKTILDLLPMTVDNKVIACNCIKTLQAGGVTNLWHGILKGIEISMNKQYPNSASAIMVLTDGYIPKLRKYTFDVPIYTFGFGYTIRSGLLKSISEYSGGSYAFIPDAGFIGTVFVHAIANLQSTFAKGATLKISTSRGVILAETTGEYVRKADESTKDRRYEVDSYLSIPLGHLQYGQSRDIVLRYENAVPVGTVPPRISAELLCQSLDDSHGAISKSCSIDDNTSLSPELMMYHRFRSMICFFLSTMAPLSTDEEHIPLPSSNLSTKRQQLEILTAKFSATQRQDERNQSLMKDLLGQIRLALEDNHFQKWGQHFLQSIHDAHVKQVCNSFKDPGPLQYGKDSTLFKMCRDKLDYLFDTLPPPIPSVTVRDGSGNVKSTAFSMKQYNNVDSNCFTAECQVRTINMAEVRASDLRPGMELWTPKGGRKIAAVIASMVKDKQMCRIGNLVITPWHPIFLDGEWGFPSLIVNSPVMYTGAIYSLLLEPDQDGEAHGVEVEGYLTSTLGHGVTQAGEENNVRAHVFFGDYEKVLDSLKSLVMKDGVLECEGVMRDVETDCICDFVRCKPGKL